MPDWTYQTVFRAPLLGIDPGRGRDIALGCMGLLSRLPFGRRVIQLMGHMHPDPRLAMERNGITFSSQVGLGCGLDPHMLATPAFAEFGLGFLEIGPVVMRAVQSRGEMKLDTAAASLRLENPRATISLLDAEAKLLRDGPLGVPLFARTEPASIAEAKEMVERLEQQVQGFVVPVQCLSDVLAALELRDEPCHRVRPLLVAIDVRSWSDESHRQRCVAGIREGRIAGVVVSATVEDDQAVILGKPGFADSLRTVQQVRGELGPQPIVIGALGVHSPSDTLDYLEAGADLVQIDSGLMFAGPGLAKRINAALLYRRLMTEAGEPALPARLGSESWFWALLMGLSMFIGGVMAMIIATTRVVMPYDEAMAGLTRVQLMEVNQRLLPFMTHDRVTLAGTMLAVGILYTTLAWWGLRRGVHWAYVSIALSAFAGFLSFFSFLGFGYFDPLHAFVTAILFQFLVLTVHSGLPRRERMEAPELWNDWRWKANQWGQLLFVIHGAVLIVAGIVISIVGMTSVFVHEDLEFMRVAAADLVSAHPRLVPLVAHDRATFGGMLISCGAVTLLPAVWGFQRGQAWLWWALMLSGSVAYCSTILVHWCVGYDSLMHLLPAYVGLEWLWGGGIASYWFLVKRDPRLETEWKLRLSRTSLGST